MVSLVYRARSLRASRLDRHGGRETRPGLTFAPDELGPSLDQQLETGLVALGDIAAYARHVQAWVRGEPRGRGRSKTGGGEGVTVSSGRVNEATGIGRPSQVPSRRRPPLPRVTSDDCDPTHRQHAFSGEAWERIRPRGTYAFRGERVFTHPRQARTHLRSGTSRSDKGAGQHNLLAAKPRDRPACELETRARTDKQENGATGQLGLRSSSRPRGVPLRIEHRTRRQRARVSLGYMLSLPDGRASHTGGRPRGLSIARDVLDQEGGSLGELTWKLPSKENIIDL